MTPLAERLRPKTLDDYIGQYPLSLTFSLQNYNKL